MRFMKSIRQMFITACIVGALITTGTLLAREKPTSNLEQIERIEGIENVIRSNIHNSDTSNRFFEFERGDSLWSLQVAEERRQEATENAAKNESGNVVEVIGQYNVYGGCVSYARSQGMQAKGYGSAINYPTTQTPQKFAITYEGRNGHAVVVEQDLGNHLQVRDANYWSYKITRRIIPKSIVKGYLS